MDWAGSEPDLWDVLCQGYQLLVTVVSVLATDCILGLTVCLGDMATGKVYLGAHGPTLVP